jgi:hypothetical protein
MDLGLKLCTIYICFDSSRKKVMDLAEGGEGGSDRVDHFFSDFFLEPYLAALPAQADVLC